MLDEKIRKFAEDTLRSFTSWDDKRDSGLTVPDGLKCRYNIEYKDGLLLDVYCPEGTSSPIKTIISVHGGAYVYGDKDRYRFYCMSLAKLGFTVVNFNYRLAPDHAYPAPIVDLNDVFWWIYRNSEEYLIDTERLYIVGDSAGAQIASQYLTILANEEYSRLFTFEAPPLMVKACALNCGMYDMKRLVLRDDRMELFDAYFQGHHEEFAGQIDVLPYINEKFPPTFLMTSYYDFLKGEAEPFSEILTERGVPHKLCIYGKEGDKHMSHVFHLDMRITESGICNKDECLFFDEWR